MAWSYFPLSSGSYLAPAAGLNELRSAWDERLPYGQTTTVVAMAAADYRLAFNRFVYELQWLINNSVATRAWARLSKDGSGFPLVNKSGCFDGAAAVEAYTVATFCADLSAIAGYTVPVASGAIGWWRELENGSTGNGPVASHDHCFPANTLNELYWALRILVAPIISAGYDSHSALHNACDTDGLASSTVDYATAYAAANGMWPLDAGSTGINPQAWTNSTFDGTNYVCRFWRNYQYIDDHGAWYTDTFKVASATDAYMRVKSVQGGTFDSENDFSTTSDTDNGLTFTADNWFFMDTVNVAANTRRIGVTTVPPNGATAFFNDLGLGLFGWEAYYNPVIVSRLTGLTYL